MELRQATLWSGLLLGSQATDTLTTAIDRARGAVEAMPLSAQMLNVGGVVLFWGFKLMVVAGATAALVAAARKVDEHNHRLARFTFRASLAAVQAATVCLAYVSISNLVLLSSIQ